MHLFVCIDYDLLIIVYRLNEIGLFVFGLVKTRTAFLDEGTFCSRS